MPGLDGTGPRGLGPMTGGGRGYCTLPAGRAPLTYPQVRVPSAFSALNPFRWAAAAWPVARLGYGTWGRGGWGGGGGWGRGGCGRRGGW